MTTPLFTRGDSSERFDRLMRLVDSCPDELPPAQIGVPLRKQASVLAGPRGEDAALADRLEAMSGRGVSAREDILRAPVEKLASMLEKEASQDDSRIEQIEKLAMIVVALEAQEQVARSTR